MVSKPTVLIVGAGGSIPYGFPAGYTLKKEIITTLPKPSSKNALRLRSLGYTDAQLSEFANELRLSGRNSIDAFLEDREEFVTIGKRAIACALIPHEHPETLFTRDPEDNWYGYLFNQVTENLKQGAVAPLTILTFNYDRSLDHFLYTSFAHSFNLAPDALRMKLRDLRIIHLHGFMGHLPLYAPAGAPQREYVPRAFKGSILAAAQDIRIVHEAGDSDPEFKAARDALRGAENICVLGFGYSFTNVQRLLIGNWIGAKNIIPAAYGSAYNLTNAERNRIRMQFQTRIQLDETGQLKCCDFLRAHVNLIS